MAAATCPNCRLPIAAAANFCPSCGFTLRAPLPAAQRVAYPPPTAGPPPQPVYAYPVAATPYFARSVPHKTGGFPIWGIAVAGVVVFMIVLGTISFAAGSALGRSTAACGSAGCRKPPTLAPPLGAPHVYTSSTYGFSVAYYDHPDFEDLVKVASEDDHSITWTVTPRAGFAFPLTVSGEEAGGASADSLVDAIQTSRFPDAKKAYAIPKMQIGFVDGAGNVYDLTITAGNGKSVRGRLIVAAAVKDGVAITIVTLGPFEKTTPDDGHPNPAQTFMANVADEALASIVFKGENPL
jgi:hypothetical protein